MDSRQHHRYRGAARTPHEYWFDALSQRLSPESSQTPTSPGSKPTAKVNWDEEIEAVQDLLVILRDRRNNVIPTPSMLPHEILGYIFEILASISPIRVILRDSSSSWLTVMLVCKQWRRVAISRATLWSTLLPFNSGQPWDLFLQRSRSSPLAVSTGLLYRQEKCSDFMDSLVHHFDRVRELSLFTHGNRNRNCIASLLSRVDASSNLRYLSLEHMSDSQNSPDMKELPSDFLSETLPKLHTIGLRCFQFPWATEALNLRVLVIHGSSSPGGTPASTSTLPALADVIRGLRQMPNLETLKLFEIFVPPVSHHEEEGIVPLPRLSNIAFHSNWLTCFQLWRALRPHPYANTEIVSREQSHAEREAAISAFRYYRSRPDSPIYRTLYIEKLPKCFCIRLEDTSPSLEAEKHSPGDPPAAKNPEISLNFWVRPGDDLSGFIMAIGMAAPIKQLHTLELEDMGALPSDGWTSLLRWASSLQVLKLNGIHLADATSVFSIMIPSSPEDQFTHLPCLRLLQLGHMYLCGIIGAAPVTEGVSLEDSTKPTLLDMLSRRHNGLAPQSPRILVLRWCSIYEHQIDELKNFVEVQDDGCEVLIQSDHGSGAEESEGSDEDTDD